LKTATVKTTYFTQIRNIISFWSCIT